MQYPLLSSVFARTPNSIWEFVELKDVLNLSIASQWTASLGISAETVEEYLRAMNRNTHVGIFSLKFPAELTIGMLRRVLNRLNNGTEAVVAIDEKSGRIVLDIGSAFNDKDAFLASAEQIPDDVSDTNQEIFKTLEMYSIDEYDDFNPRHPVPRDKAHRRGDSYFNSDINEVVNELQGGMAASNAIDLKSAAAAALAGDDDQEPVSEGVAGMSLKDRMMAKKKNAAKAGSATKAKTHRAFQALTEEED